MLKCSWCEQVFESVDGLIPVFDSVISSGKMIYIADRRAHDLFKITQADLDADKSAGSLASLMSLLEPGKEPGRESAEKDAPVYQ
jgi:hypothetical protein